MPYAKHSKRRKTKVSCCGLNEAENTNMQLVYERKRRDMPFIQTNDDTQIYYRSWGKGKPVVFVSPALPCLLEREDNPFGVPWAVLDYTIAALHKDRVLFFTSVANKYFASGSSWPAPDPVSSELVQWGVRESLNASAKAVLECGRAHLEGDFRPDLRTFTVPTLVIQRQNDQNAPLDLCGRPTAREIPGSELKVYEGAPHGLFFTHKDRLTEDLLTFIRG
jgi:pimeloyl-ACP methyl ester carboxylesterase